MKTMSTYACTFFFPTYTSLSHTHTHSMLMYHLERDEENNRIHCLATGKINQFSLNLLFNYEWTFLKYKGLLLLSDIQPFDPKDYFTKSK